ncbi:MAG: AmmeMemoRadiSam system protein B [Anaerolineales bacterium]
MQNQTHPKIRNLNPHPIIHQGQSFLVLRDPLRLTEHSVVLPQFLAPLILLCDGSRTKNAIRAILRLHFGLPIDKDTLDRFLDIFDEMLLLDNERTTQAREQALMAYRSAPFRPPALAGSSYPANPAALHRHLQDYLEAADVSPHPDGGSGLLSPHIDYLRGGEVYAQVWKRAAKMVKAADLVIVLGTDHHGGHNPLTLTRQNYATPFGVLPTDRDVVNAIAESIGEKIAFTGELYHRDEHSIELVATWLQHLRDKKPVPIVPILCGSFASHVFGEEHIENNPFINNLVETVRSATRGRNVFYVISGDLAHVGPAFSGEPLNDQGRNAIQAADDELLQQMAAGNASGFFHAIQHVRDQNNVCGTIPVYLAMRMMGEVSGEVTGYRQCPADEQGTSIVSVGGVVFT